MLPSSPAKGRDTVLDRRFVTHVPSDPNGYHVQSSQRFLDRCGTERSVRPAAHEAPQLTRRIPYSRRVRGGLLCGLSRLRSMAGVVFEPGVETPSLGESPVVVESLKTRTATSMMSPNSSGSTLVTPARVSSAHLARHSAPRSPTAAAAFSSCARSWFASVDRPASLRASARCSGI